jgi:serine/threonine protein kinase
MSPIAKALESEFGAVLGRVGPQVAGRFHTGSDRIEGSYDLSDTVLGAGSNGDVRLARSRSDGVNKFAVKTVAFSGIAGIDEWEMLENQLEVALLVDHPHLVGVTDVYETDEALHMVMPCMEGGALIDDEFSTQVFDRAGKDSTREMLLALSYLHSHGIVHRDIKPSNYVLEQKQGTRVKLIDYDLCAFWLPGDEPMYTSCGTPGFTSPELRSGKGYTSQTDMWSLGITLFRLFVGQMPFSLQETPDQDAVDKLLSSQVAAGLQPEALDLIRKLLRVDPAERVNAEDALLHPFVAVASQEQRRDVAVSSQCGSRGRKCGRGRRQLRRPQRCGRAVSGGSVRRESCRIRMSGTSELVKLKEAFIEQPPMTIPVVPLRQKDAKVRWVDFDEEDDVPTEPGW